MWASGKNLKNSLAFLSRLDIKENMSMKQQDANELAVAMRRAFERSGMSILQLSKRANTTYSNTHGFVTGKCDLTLRIASKFCKVLGLKLKK